MTWENKTRTNHGLLEIKHNGVWGTVCDDSVNVTQTAEIACRQLGWRTVLRPDIGGSWNNRRPEQMWLDEVDCQGTETRLEQV